MVPGSSPGGRTNKKYPLGYFLFVRRSAANSASRRKPRSADERRRMRPTGAFDADPGRNEGGAFRRRLSEIAPLGYFLFVRGWQVEREASRNLPAGKQARAPKRNFKAIRPSGRIGGHPGRSKSPSFCWRFVRIIKLLFGSFYNCYLI